MFPSIRTVFQYLQEAGERKKFLANIYKLKAWRYNTKQYYISMLKVKNNHLIWVDFWQKLYTQTKAKFTLNCVIVQFKTKLHLNHQETCKKLSSVTFKLFKTKVLIFVSTPNTFGKNQLGTDAENLFCLIKLRAPFNNIKIKLNTDPINQIF